MDKTKAGPKDVFLHLLAIVLLYVSVGSFIALIFQYINVWMPDIASSGGYFDLSGYYSSIRWYMAVLIIVFPVYIWASWYLNKEYIKEPAKRELKVRKWLLYLTLFIMAIVIIGDLVTLIYNFLQGELTTRFLLKILAVLAVSGKVFAYYLMDLRQKAPQKLFAYGVSAIVLAFLVAGFFVAGSPQEARMRQFDAIRLQNLQMIQDQIVYYWQQKGALPPNLDALRNDISGFVAPQDPETSTPYDYSASGPLSFSICTNFALPSLQNQPDTRHQTIPAPYSAKPYPAFSPGIAQNWDHAAGHVCFERTIDKDFYKPAPKTL